MTTLSFPPGCAFAKIHPMDTSKLVCVSAQGLVRTMDIYGRETGAGEGYEVEGSDTQVSTARATAGSTLTTRVRAAPH